MMHIDEHTLERYVLDPAALGDEAAWVKTHIHECGVCADLVAQIRTYYSLVEETYVRAEQDPGVKSQSLVVRREPIPELLTPIGRIPARQRRQERGVIRGFARRHPIMSGTGAFAVMAGLFAAFVLTTSGPSDVNPSYVHLNPAQELVEVYNEAHERLWQLPAQDLQELAGLEERGGTPAVQVCDLDGDGTREVVSIAKLSTDSRKDTRILRVFDSQGDERSRKKLGRSHSFAGAEYGGDYNPSFLLVLDPGSDGKREIIVGASNYRSPFVLAKVSASGEVLGEYWHFGQIYGISSLKRGTKNYVLGWGTNDTPDTSGHAGGSFAMVFLLDPAQLVGNTESGFTRGFGYLPSSAEKRYIRLPRSDVEEVLDFPVAAVSMLEERDSLLTFSVSGPPDPSGNYTLYYSFTKDLVPVEVKHSDFSDMMQSDLVAGGKLKSRWTRSYFDSLKSRIEYLK